MTTGFGALYPANLASVYVRGQFVDLSGAAMRGQVTLTPNFAPVLLERKAARLRKETGNDLLRSKLDVGLSPRDYFKRGIVRPVKMFIYSPIVAILAFYMAIIYSYLYLLFTTFTDVFQRTYHFSTSIVGLAYLGLGVGSFIGLLLFSTTTDRYVQKKAAEAEAVKKLANEAKNTA